MCSIQLRHHHVDVILELRDRGAVAWAALSPNRQQDRLTIDDDEHGVPRVAFDEPPSVATVEFASQGAEAGALENGRMDLRRSGGAACRWHGSDKR